MAAVDRYLKVTELCDYLSVSDETIYRWIKGNGLPAHRIGKRWMFRKAEVDLWVETGEAGVCCSVSEEQLEWKN